MVKNIYSSYCNFHPQIYLFIFIGLYAFYDDNRAKQADMVAIIFQRVSHSVLRYDDVAYRIATCGHNSQT